MAQPGDWPSWLQVVLAATVALVTGVVGAASSAILIALGINRKFSELEKSFIVAINGLRQHVDTSDSQRFHNVVTIVQAEIGKSELIDQELGKRIGACEQDLAILRDFKGRYEAHIAAARRQGS